MINQPVPDDHSDEEGPGSNIRYGRIPQRVPRRYKTIKRVELVVLVLLEKHTTLLFFRQTLSWKLRSR